MGVLSLLTLSWFAVRRQRRDLGLLLAVLILAASYGAIADFPPCALRDQLRSRGTADDLGLFLWGSLNFGACVLIATGRLGSRPRLSTLIACILALSTAICFALVLIL